MVGSFFRWNLLHHWVVSTTNHVLINIDALFSLYFISIWIFSNQSIISTLASFHNLQDYCHSFNVISQSLDLIHWNSMHNIQAKFNIRYFITLFHCNHVPFSAGLPMEIAFYMTIVSSNCILTWQSNALE